ncbi:MAG TPA: GFA family protein [Steroidobacteraceae bacterium]|nr:GFA family protein [Steroidobacteraceae bacterium]
MIRGSCLCGTVRFEISGALDRASHCHCSMCRKAHGAAFGSYAGVPKAALRWTAGEASISRYASSGDVTRTFCSVCGSRLEYLHRAQPDRIAIALGVLDDDPGVRPELHLFVADRAPWYDLADGLPRFAGDA